jgi:hypothetical protein
MNARWALVILMLIGASAAMAQDAATQPSDESAATTQPSQIQGRFGRYNRNREFGRRNQQQSSVQARPAIYDAVAARNIFIRGDQRPPPVDANPQPVGPARQYEATATQLVLTGVSLEESTKVAILEDQSAFTAQQVKVGDQIANGKIVNITLDALDYKDPNGNIIRVQVGFNLAGGDVWGVANSSSSPGASTQPALTGPRGANESMEDYLKRRRAAELGH